MKIDWKDLVNINLKQKNTLGYYTRLYSIIKLIIREQFLQGQGMEVCGFIKVLKIYAGFSIPIIIID